jgi:hypothetical protein
MDETQIKGNKLSCVSSLLKTDPFTILGFGGNWLMKAELRALIHQSMEDLFFDLCDDENMQIELAYYF